MTSPEDRTRFLQDGMDDYTIKPVKAVTRKTTIASWANL